MRFVKLFFLLLLLSTALIDYCYKVEEQPSRFIVSANGVITDPATKLEWIVGPDKDTSIWEANRWLENCTIAGGGWRMPKIDELAYLYRRGLGTRNMDPVFETTGWLVWGELRGLESWQYPYSFYVGVEYVIFPGSEKEDHRVFGVRSQSNEPDNPIHDVDETTHNT